jgi:antitoxin component YwqK of YwqJK toxin-antitoxin module
MSDNRKVGEGMKERIDRHKDGSIKAKGHMMDGELEGYWEWFRLDGSKLRSGHFKSGKQVGEWTTYDATGKVVKVTNFPD